MRQSEVLEEFKQQQRPVHALHVFFDLDTGFEVLSVEEYGHLQVRVLLTYLCNKCNSIYAAHRAVVEIFLALWHVPTNKTRNLQFPCNTSWWNDERLQRRRTELTVSKMYLKCSTNDGMQKDIAEPKKSA